MARKTSSTPEVPTEPVQEDTVTSTEVAPEVTDTDTNDSVAEAETEAPETATEEAASAPVVEPEPEAPIDLTAFEAAVQASRSWFNDEAEIDDEHLAPVLAAYTALSGTKAKNAARKSLSAGMKAFMKPTDGTAPNFPAAQQNMTLIDSLQVVKAPKEPKEAKAPVDPTDAFVDQYLALVVATQLLAKNPPEGVADDWKTRAQTKINLPETGEAVRAYGAYLADASEAKAAIEVPSFVSAGYKVAQGKAIGKVGAKKSGGTGVSTGPRTGPTRNILVHIQNAFADKPVGTFLKVSQIVATPSDEYPGTTPSSGAVSARITATSWEKLAGEIGLALDTVDGAKGLRKVA